MRSQRHFPFDLHVRKRVDIPPNSRQFSIPMRFIQPLSHETLQLLHRVHKQSRHHRVRQRAHCIVLSSQGYTTTHLADIFQVDRITIYHWFNAWEQKGFAGLYSRKGPGRPPLFTPEQRDQLREWIKQFPKNLNKIRSLIHDEFDLDVSKQTIKRVLKSYRLIWKRMRKRVKGRPAPELYQEHKASLEIRIEEDRDGIIDLRYFDESGFLFSALRALCLAGTWRHDVA